MAPIASDRPLRRAVALVALLNLGYFGFEFTIASAIGSVSLFADSIDFLEDTSVNLLILIGLGLAAKSRARLGMGLAVLLLAPSVAALWTAWSKIGDPAPPAAFALGLTGLGALAVNLGCAFILARFRTHQGSLTKAAFLSARNDAIANVAIIAAAIGTGFTHSFWPDLAVGLAIAALNARSAKEVWDAAREEHRGEDDAQS